MANCTVDIAATIHDKGLLHLFSHFKEMQDKAAAYVADHETPGHRRDSDFIGNMLEALDGPEQRAIEAEIENPFDYVAEANVTLSREFHGELVSKAAFVGALNNAIQSLQKLDAIKKAWFYGRAAQGITQGITMTEDLPAVIGDASNLSEADAAVVLHGIIGIATEAGELLEALRETLSGKSLDVVNLKEEVGDAKWYMAILAPICGFAWGDDERVNIAKLRKRFADKFAAYDANNRNLVAERAILEGCDTLADSDGDDGA